MDRNTIKRSCLPLSDNFCQRPCCALATHESFRAFRDLQRPTGRDQISSRRAHFTFECGLCTLPASVHSRKGQSESQRLLLAMPKMCLYLIDTPCACFKFSQSRASLILCPVLPYRGLL